MSIDVNWRGTNVYVSIGEEVSSKEIMNINEKIVGDYRFDQIEYQIWDFNDTKSFKLEEIDLKVVVSLDISSSCWNKHMKVGFVATNDEIKRIVAEYLTLMEKSSWQNRLFETKEEAIAWCKQSD